LTLADFYKHDYYAAVEPKSEKDLIAAIKPLGVPDNGKDDYDATLRGLRKNLILLDIFSFSQRSEPFYERAREAIAKAKGGTTPPGGK